MRKSDRIRISPRNPRDCIARYTSLLSSMLLLSRTPAVLAVIRRPAAPFNTPTVRLWRDSNIWPAVSTRRKMYRCVIASIMIASCGRRKARSALSTWVHGVHSTSKDVNVTAVSTRMMSNVAVCRPCTVMRSGPSAKAAMGSPGVRKIAGNAITPVKPRTTSHTRLASMTIPTLERIAIITATTNNAPTTAIFRESITARTMENSPTTRTRGSSDCKNPTWRAICSEAIARARARAKPTMVEVRKPPRLIRNDPLAVVAQHNAVHARESSSTMPTANIAERR